MALNNTKLTFTNANYVNADKCYYIYWAEFSCNFDGQLWIILLLNFWLFLLIKQIFKDI